MQLYSNTCLVEDMAKLQVLLLLCIACFEVSNTACTEGFMNLDLLTKRATKLMSPKPMNKLDAQLCLVPDLSFNCNGRITHIYIGAIIKATTSRALPEIQIWRVNSMNYTRQENQQIKLNPGNFSPNGVLQYNLDPPMSFQSGDVLGVYQPPERDSAVTVYYHEHDDFGRNKMHCVTIFSSPPSILTEHEPFDILNDKKLLILPETDNPNCVQNFPSRNEFDQWVLDANINDVKVIANQRLIPEIKFTCKGSITKWIVGARSHAGKNSEQFPELQIWRSMDGANYSKVGFSLLTSDARRFNNLFNVYVYTPNPPLEFQEGDVLGMCQPIVDSEMEIGYQIFDGPANYEVDYTDTVNIVSLSVLQYDYPLVTVEIVSSTSLTPPDKSSTPIQTSSSLETISSLESISASSSLESLSTSSSLENISASKSSETISASSSLVTISASSSLEPISTSSLKVLQTKMPDSQQVVLPLFAFAIISVAATLIVVAAVITLVFIILFLCRCKKNFHRNLRTDQNLCYVVNTQSVNNEESENNDFIPHSQIDVQDNSCYTKSNLNDLQNNICYARQSPINLQNNPCYSDSIDLQSNSCSVTPDQDTVPEMPPIYAEVEDLYI